MSSFIRKNVLALAALGIVPIIFIQFSSQGVSILLVLVLFYYVFITAFINNKLGLLLFILIRPSLDCFTDVNVLDIGSFSMNVASIYAILLLLFAGYIILKNIKQIYIKQFLLMYLFFFVILISGVFFSSSKSISVVEIVRIFSISVIFLLSYLLIKKKKDFLNLIQIIIGSTLVPAMVAFYQYFTKTGLSTVSEYIYNRLYGTFSHPNTFALYLVLSIALIFIILGINNKKEVKIIVYGFYSFILFVLLLLTLARGALIALFIVILIAGIVKYKKAVVAFMVMIIFSYLISTPIQQRFNELIHPDPYGSIAYRLDLYKDIITYTKEKPFTGYGIGTASKIISENRANNPHPHNDYLKIGMETGLFGLFVYVLLILNVVYFLIKSYFEENKDSVIKTINLFLIAISVAIFVAAGGDNVLRNTSLQWSYWALIGGFIALKIKKAPYLN